MDLKKNKIYYFIFFLFISIGCSSVFSAPMTESKTKIWLKNQLAFNLTKIRKNILTNGNERGAVIAAIKSENAPNYYYHWVRDAALVVMAIVKTYPALSTKDKIVFADVMNDYIDFSSRIQKTYTLADLGEPKFNVDGSAFNESWARPQNDGPATRAISLIAWAKILMAEGKEEIVRRKLYDTKLPADLPIKKDLEYVSHHWQDPSYDIWEEVKGKHFYTLMMERRALLEGAELARLLLDEGAADWYYKQGKAIEVELEKFWNEEQSVIMPTLDRIEGIAYKTSNIDTAVILGLLYGNMNDGFLSWHDPRVIATLNKIIQTMLPLYAINDERKAIPGIAIGRYPEDKYGGLHFNGGNPWVLTTLAVAQVFYHRANELARYGDDQGAKQASDYADTFVERVRYHAHKDDSLNEQIDRNTGYMVSVQDLTWNYAALLFLRDALY